MTHQLETNLPENVLQLLMEPEAGDSRFSAVLRLLLNEAMKLERAPFWALAPMSEHKSEPATPTDSNQRLCSRDWDLWSWKCLRCEAEWTFTRRLWSVAFAASGH